MEGRQHKWIRQQGLFVIIAARYEESKRKGACVDDQENFYEWCERHPQSQHLQQSPKNKLADIAHANDWPNYKPKIEFEKQISSRFEDQHGAHWRIKGSREDCRAWKKAIWTCCQRRQHRWKNQTINHGEPWDQSRCISPTTNQRKQGQTEYGDEEAFACWWIRL